MSGLFGVDLLKAQISKRAADGVDENLEDFFFISSEIERLLMTAVWGLREFRQHSHICPCRNTEAVDYMKARPFDPISRSILLVALQTKVAGWRTDFVFYAPSLLQKFESPRVPTVIEHWRALIVECDGHDYHERTKEQAARDRSRDRKAQQEGFTIYRFTGSEIWRDPLGCAERIFDWADGGLR